LNGRLTLKDIQQWVRDNEAGANQSKRQAVWEKRVSHSNNYSIELAVYKQKFTELAAKRFITAVLPEDSKSRIDRRLEAEAKAADAILLGPSRNEKQDIEIKVQLQLEKEDESRQMIGMVSTL
jgi:hypothetical protein